MSGRVHESSEVDGEERVNAGVWHVARCTGKPQRCESTSNASSSLLAARPTGDEMGMDTGRKWTGLESLVLSVSRGELSAIKISLFIDHHRALFDMLLSPAYVPPCTSLSALYLSSTDPPARVCPPSRSGTSSRTRRATRTATIARGSPKWPSPDSVSSPLPMATWRPSESSVSLPPAQTLAHLSP